ncbi:hypothetical protein AALA00_00265 [Lachnospiraceae bacterium 46-15]
MALQRIEEKRYTDELHDNRYQELVRYRIAFFSKDCVVRKERCDENVK